MFVKLKTVCEHLAVTSFKKEKQLLNIKVRLKKQQHVFGVEGTNTEKTCCLLSMTIFSFTETVLCINNCEEINLLSKEIYWPTVTRQIALGLLNLGSISKGFISTQTDCSHFVPPCWALTPWFALNLFPAFLPVVLLWCLQRRLCSVFQ